MSKQILVVEDELVVAKDIQNRLESLGYSVPAMVSSGEEAVRKAAEIRPDLVLMDIKLEGDMDGVEAAEKIWQSLNIPVIYLTAYGDDQTLQRAKLTEPFGYILKPFETRELHSNIAMTLHKHRIESKLREKEEWLSTLLESIGDAVIATDKEENITFMNVVAEALTGWKQKEVLGKTLNTAFNIVNEKDHSHEESLAKVAIRKNAITNLEERNVMLVTKDGEEKTIDDSAAPIKDHEGNITGCIIVFRDVSRRRQAELELERYRHHLETLVEERTNELTTTNEQLQSEIVDRRRAEEEANETKENLQNIINSASEVIISIDRKNRVTLWNRTAELITGYKGKNVIGKHVAELPVFSSSDELLDNLKSFFRGKKPRFNELILKTKDGNKRIIRVSSSPVKTNGEQYTGVLFVGTDITQDLETHGRLLKGNCYLIPDKDNKSALDLFITLCKSDYEGLFITRATPGIIKDMTLLRGSQVTLLSQEKLGEFENISNPGMLLTSIKGFAEGNPQPVILLDGVHYLLTRFSFEEFADALYQIREIVSNTNSILFLRLDPLLLDRRQMAVVKNELQPLPSQKIDDVEIRDELYDLLKFIYKQKQNNNEVSIKKISKEFSIVGKTSTKRVKMLENMGLIFTKKRGRLKTLHLSQKGKKLLRKRQMG
ncbi:MAG: PAS domain S-box protein [Petrotogales bacterium]